MNTTYLAPTTEAASAADALITIRLTIAAQVGRLREAAERPGAGGREIGQAIAFYETGDLWLGEAIEVAAEEAGLAA